MKYKIETENREIVVWGTGEIADLCMKKHKTLSILFFVDNDGEKEKGEFRGKPLRKPEELNKKSNQYFIVVASEFCEEVAGQLKAYGYKECRDYIFWQSIKVEATPEYFETNIASNLENLKKSGIKGQTLLFSSITRGDVVKKGEFFRKLYHQLGGKLVLMQEASSSEMASIDIPFVVLPKIMREGQYVQKDFYWLNKDGKLIKYDFGSNGAKERIEYSETLFECAQTLRLKFPQMEDGFEFYMTDLVAGYIAQMINLIQPKYVILWNEFLAIHKIVKYICEEKKISMRFIEFGNLAGTIQFDKKGQMGESWLAADDVGDYNLMISGDDLLKAKTILRYLYLSKANRKTQPLNSIWSCIGDRINVKTPIIVFAGQNDYDAGIQIYTSDSKKFHSPIFKSSDEAAIYLWNLCKKRGWNFIYKPHPYMIANMKVCSELPADMPVLEKGDINDTIDLGDLVVTIVSTTAYVAMTRNKPILMLGYTQLKNSGCTYEAFCKDDVEGVIEKALCEGFTEEMKKAFIKHVAILNKYYLFENKDDMLFFSYGRDISEFDIEKIH